MTFEKGLQKITYENLDKAIESVQHSNSILRPYHKKVFGRKLTEQKRREG